MYFSLGISLALVWDVTELSDSGEMLGIDNPQE